MASPTQQTWVWVKSGSWWWTGRPGVLRFMGSQRVGRDWATELHWGIQKKPCYLKPLALIISLILTSSLVFEVSWSRQKLYKLLSNKLIKKELGKKISTIQSHIFSYFSTIIILTVIYRLSNILKTSKFHNNLIGAEPYTKTVLVYIYLIINYEHLFICLWVIYFSVNYSYLCCCCLVAKLCLTISIRLLCPQDFPGKNTGVGGHFLLQEIFPTQGSTPHLLHYQAGSLLLSHQGGPIHILCLFYWVFEFSSLSFWGKFFVY